MKRNALILVIMMFAALSISAYAAGKKDAKPQKPTAGVAVSLSAELAGKGEKLSQADADKLVSAGQPIVLKVGTGKSAKLYFVINKDGSYAAKELAKYTKAKQIAVYGKITKVNGLNVINADNISALD